MYNSWRWPYVSYRYAAASSDVLLQLTDICIKNGGDHFLVEVASREFMDNLVSILKTPALNIDVKNNILRLVQNWAVAFEGKSMLSYVGQVYKTLKGEGPFLLIVNYPDSMIIHLRLQISPTRPRRCQHGHGGYEDGP
jgi:hypothetical protein